MCGINGIFAYGSLSEPICVEELARVRDSMASRGPDGVGKWVSEDGRVGFGHRRLSIIDLSEGGNQPKLSENGKLAITFNGEIYNFQELKGELETKGHHFGTNSDSEVILAVYQEWGATGFQRLRGMFAFALWDGDRKQLLLARDPLGIKPLYVADNGKTLRFGSQVKALLMGCGINRSPDPAGHVGFFLWGHVPEPFSLFEGVRMLSPGTVLTVERSGRKTESKFFDFKGCLLEHSATEETPDLAGVLRDSVRAHFVSDVPVSLFLSAGKDSATLLALASEVRSEPVQAVTLAFHEFKGTSLDEAPLSAEIAKHYGANHLVHYVSPEDFRTDLSGLLGSMDQPSIDGANTYFVCKVARQLGVKVAISGLGADELFGGYASFRQVPHSARALRWANSVPWLGRGVRALGSHVRIPSLSAKYAGLLEYGGTLEGAYMLRRALYMPWEMEQILDRDFAAEGLKRLSEGMNLQEIASDLPTTHARIVALEYASYMKNRLLRDSDWASMAHSVELRSPFVDSEVMRTLGAWLASESPPTKCDMTSTPLKRLPQEVLSRPKSGFMVPMHEWVQGLEAPRSSGEQSWRRWSQHVYRHFAGDNLLSKKQEVLAE